MSTKFHGKTVLVTGGAVRIGKSIALAFARQGATIVVHYRQSADSAGRLLNELRQLGDGHGLVKADLSIAAERQTLIPAALKVSGRIDILINNASIYKRRSFLDVTEEEARKDWEINFWGPFMLMRDFARQCGKGNIINMLDQRVAATDPAVGVYGLAKKSLRDATEAAAIAWAPDIRVNGIAPGLVLPPPGVPEHKMIPLLKEVPMKINSKPQEIADACLFLAGSETITGNIIYVDGGLHLT